jgi:hypothetical protein
MAEHYLVAGGQNPRRILAVLNAEETLRALSPSKIQKE